MKQLLYLLLTALILTSCSSDKEEPINPEPETPALISLSFLCYDNPMQLTADVRGEIVGDSIVDCWVPNLMSDKELIPKVEYVGESIMFDDVPAAIGSTKHDFKKPAKLTIANGNKSKDYTVYVHSFTGLPVMWIETKGRQDITSKDEYLRASFKLVENSRTRAAGDVIKDSVNIKGRGNSTWGMDKKPYALKFDKKISLLGEPKDKSWVLLANYTDKTMLRNHMAFYLGKISNLDYTPRCHFVELMLNGRYNGTYQLCEKLKISEDRVNVGDDGFLLEIDGKAGDDEITFATNHLDHPVNIKDPDVIVNDENYNYIKDFVITAENALYSDEFTDLNMGWQKYIDIDSFVDWYLVNEITHNTDALFYTSCYVNLRRGDKLKMGPLWDFDIAFGNTDYTDRGPEGFWSINAPWIYRMFQDPAFVTKVKERFNFFYCKRDDIMREINANTNYLKYAVQENENRWHIFYTYTWPNYDIWGSYNNEVQSMKEWLIARFDWLKSEFDKM